MFCCEPAISSIVFMSKNRKNYKSFISFTYRFIRYGCIASYVYTLYFPSEAPSSQSPILCRNISMSNITYLPNVNCLSVITLLIFSIVFSLYLLSPIKNIRSTKYLYPPVSDSLRVLPTLGRRPVLLIISKLSIDVI